MTRQIRDTHHLDPSNPCIVSVNPAAYYDFGNNCLGGPFPDGSYYQLLDYKGDRIGETNVSLSVNQFGRKLSIVDQGEGVLKVTLSVSWLDFGGSLPKTTSVVSYLSEWW